MVLQGTGCTEGSVEKERTVEPGTHLPDGRQAPRWSACKFWSHRGRGSSPSWGRHWTSPFTWSNLSFLIGKVGDGVHLIGLW